MVKKAKQFTRIQSQFFTRNVL